MAKFKLNENSKMYFNGVELDSLTVVDLSLEPITIEVDKTNAAFEKLNYSIDFRIKLNRASWLRTKRLFENLTFRERIMLRFWELVDWWQWATDKRRFDRWALFKRSFGEWGE